jgi:putative tryptophan/tyrosine transport system substrate-binding protein
MFFCRLILLSFLLAFANQVSAKTAKPYKVMMLLFRGTTDAEKGFMAYFKRNNIPVEFIIRDAQADKDKILDFVREAKEIKPDLIYTFGTTVTTEVVGLQGKSDPAVHITDIPVVFNIVADPIGAKLVSNLKSSGRNLTGASHLVPLAAQMKALQTMRNTQSLGVIYNPDEKNSMLAVQELEKIAPQFKIGLQLVPIALDTNQKPTQDGLAQAVKKLLADKPQFIYIPSDSFLIKNARTMIQAAHAAKIPVFSATEAPIRTDGALLGLVSTYFNVGEFAAYKAEQILVKKVAPSKIPVEVLGRFTYLVNMTAAKKLNVYPPLSVLKFAEVITPAESIDATE